MQAPRWSRSDGPRGLAARTRTPRSRGGYRLAGDPAPPASCSGRAQVDASPAHLTWGFLERVVRAPSLSNPGLPAGKGKGANTSSGGADVSERGEIDWSGKKVKRRGDAYVSTPLPRGGGHAVRARARCPCHGPWTHESIKRRGRVRFVCTAAGCSRPSWLATISLTYLHIPTHARV